MTKERRSNLVNMNKFKDPAIYALRAGDGEIRYVGATKGNSKNRLWEHIYRANSGHRGPVYVWMREVGVRNVEVIDLEKIDDVSRIHEIEADWIRRLIEEGVDLVNQIARDGIVNSMSEESKKRIGSAKKGRDTWIKGKTGDAAGWTAERRAKQSARIRELNRSRTAA